MSKSRGSLAFFWLIFFILLGLSRSYAETIVTFGPGETKLIGIIPYSVIGKYKAQFRVFKGRIVLDEKLKSVRSVDLEIQVNSIKSNCPWCDRVARSRRLLFAARYPKIIFKSYKIIQDDKGYKVIGLLTMHGIKRRMTFPFNAGTMVDRKTDRRWLELRGSWTINRKDFNIIWNRYLDRGGVLVGDNFTVNWGIRIYLIP